MKKNVWETARRALSEKGMSWDNSDEMDPRGQRGAAPAAPGPGVRTKEMPGLPWRGDRKNLPGLPPEKVHDMDDLGGVEVDETPEIPRRRGSPTMPLPIDYKSPGMIAQNAGNLRSPDPTHPSVANAPEYNAQSRRRRQDMPTRQIPISRPTESTTGANGAGHQAPIIGDAEEAGQKVYFREALDQVFMETVRKLPNGKYGVYMTNKGKKKAPKKVGEYPDKVAAREAELARGGKSGEAAKKERDKLNKLKKDPKKLAAAKAKDKKTKKESIVNSMVAGLTEALFREDDVAGSPWDERLAGLSTTALASNKKLSGHTKAIHKASVASLMDAHKGLSKAMKKHGKVVHGEIGTETGGKMYLPCMIHGRDGDEHGPIHFYVDGGHVKMEMDEGMNETLDNMDEGEGHKLRGALMAFQQKELPKIDGARCAVAKRDADLDRMEKDHDAELSGRDGVSLHLLKHLIGAKHGRRYR